MVIIKREKEIIIIRNPNLTVIRSVYAKPKGGEGGTPHMKGCGDARRLAQGCTFRILVSLRVFWAKRHHI